MNADTFLMLGIVAMLSGLAAMAEICRRNRALAMDIERNLNRLDRLADEIELKSLALQEAIALIGYGALDEANDVILERVLELDGGPYDDAHRPGFPE